ncbi:STAS domain-containing protein [Isoptericola sp. NPDC019693]|uniref:STAS domain-containing protein n=1 Tax=Isoptericola sp. NPDC019693 TaxID=3364009 RepID=UPI0037AB648E
MTTIPAVAPRRPVELDRLVLDHQLALVDLLSRMDGMRERLRRAARHDPVEHVSWRLKPWDSIVAKALREGIALTPDALRERMLDLAGVRFTCASPSDLARVRDALLALPGVTLVEERDGVSGPEPGGYRTLRLVVRVSGARGEGHRDPAVEIQLRTVATDPRRRAGRPLTSLVTRPAAPAAVAASQEAEGVVLRLSGALDAACLDDARGALALLASAGCRRVVVDAHDVTFMDSAGVTLLDRVRRRCRAAGVPVTLLDPAAAVTDVLELLGLGGLLPVARSAPGPAGDRWS